MDNFETAIRRRKQTKGIIVAFSVGKGAFEEIARAQLHDSVEIKALTIKELLKKPNPNNCMNLIIVPDIDGIWILIEQIPLRLK